MKYILIVSLFLMVPMLEIYGQSGTNGSKSPKQVVGEFWKLETEGGRLTPEGWYRVGNSFFVHSSRPPEKRTIGVISSKYRCSMDQRLVKGNHAEIVNECIELGRIDHELRYTPPDPHHDKMDVVHYLVLTDKYSEIAADGITEREVSIPLSWRIENPEPLLWLNLDTAVRYVEDARERTADPTLKKNANKTLSQLTKLQ